MPPLNETPEERRARLSWEAHVEECDRCPDLANHCGVGGARLQKYEIVRVQSRFAREMAAAQGRQ